MHLNLLSRLFCSSSVCFVPVVKMGIKCDYNLPNGANPVGAAGQLPALPPIDTALSWLRPSSFDVTAYYERPIGNGDFQSANSNCLLFGEVRERVPTQREVKDDASLE